MPALTWNARLTEIEDAGHDVHLDQPAAWRAAIEGFVLSERPYSS